jgi:hypothetical protein
MNEYYKFSFITIHSCVMEFSIIDYKVINKDIQRLCMVLYSHCCVDFGRICFVFVVGINRQTLL